MRVQRISNPPSADQLLTRFGRRTRPFFLDSSQHNDDLGQFSFFGADPYRVLRGRNGCYRISEGDAERAVEGNGLQCLRELLASTPADNGVGCPFVGGAVGFLAYDYGRQLERLPVRAADDMPVDDLDFGFYDGIVAIDHRNDELLLIAAGVARGCDETIERLEALCFEPVEAAGTGAFAIGDWCSHVDAKAYLDAVEQVRAFIASGDVYQVNLSRRYDCAFDGDPIALYRALRAANPAPYSAYLDTGALQLLSTSPEQLLRKRGREVRTRPIKGTRPRSDNPRINAAHRRALEQSAKDRAELLMIVDLERNDLGRVAEYGSVRVEQLYHLEEYASVIHQTAQVVAELRPDKDALDCLAAIFPGGSITGAPKVRAMEIIEMLEPTRRGIYTGSIGYLGYNGDAEFNIAIRTLQLAAGRLSYQVGGGIVWDSDPQAEYQETLDKGRAIRETIDQTCNRI